MFADSLCEIASLLIPSSFRERDPDAMLRANHHLCRDQTTNGNTNGHDICGTTQVSERAFYGWDVHANRIEMLAQCRVAGQGPSAAESKGRSSLSSDSVGSSSEQLEVMEAKVIEPYVTKVTSLSAAVEAASAIIRIGDVVIEL